MVATSSSTSACGQHWAQTSVEEAFGSLFAEPPQPLYAVWRDTPSPWPHRLVSSRPSITRSTSNCLPSIVSFALA